MALNVQEILCGLNVCPVLSSGSKPQLSIELRDLGKIKGAKDAETGEVPLVYQSLSQRAISSVSAYLLPTLPLPVQEMLAATWCENTNEELFKLLKGKSQSMLEFHKGVSAMIADNTEESESASNANPDLLISKFVMTLIGKSNVITKVTDPETGEEKEVETSVPTPLPKDRTEYRAMAQSMFKDWITSDDNVDAALAHTKKTAEVNGRLESGQVRPKALPKKKDEPAPAPTDSASLPAVSEKEPETDPAQA